MSTKNETLSKKHIVNIGGGFARLKLARKLNNHPLYKITLIDKNNYHHINFCYTGSRSQEKYSTRNKD